MQREPKVFLEDIYAAAVKVEAFTDGFSFDAFENNELVSDAVIKNILVIGEACVFSFFNLLTKHWDR